MREISSYPDLLGTSLRGFMMARHVKRTSSAVNGGPSCHFTPRRKWYVIVMPSRLMPPFASEGTTAARSGTSWLLSSRVIKKPAHSIARSVSIACVPTTGFRLSGTSLAPIRRTPGTVHAFGPPPGVALPTLVSTREHPAEHADAKIIAENIAANRFLNAVLHGQRTRWALLYPASVRNVGEHFPYISLTDGMTALIDAGRIGSMAELARTRTFCIPAPRRDNRMSVIASGRIIVAILVVLSCCCSTSVAGTTGGISGRVSDQLGAPLAGAKVTVTSPSQISSAVSDARGFYSLLNLTPDTYTITASKDGFDTAQLAGITVQADQTASAAISMRPTVKVLTTVTTTAVASVVNKSVTADLYAVNAAAIGKY